MDEEINNSSQTNQRTESMNCESQKTSTEMDSDSELLADDTLRMEESDEEAAPVVQYTGVESASTAEELINDRKPQPDIPQPKQSIEEASIDVSHVIERESDREDASETNEGPTKKLSQIMDSESEEESSKVGRARQKKISKIIDSDSDDEIATKDRKNENDCGQSLLEQQNKEVDMIGEKIEQSMNRLKSLIDSDSSSPEEHSDEEITKKKKLKTKKELEKARDKSNDLLTSLNLDFSDDDSRTGGHSDAKSSDESDEERVKKENSKSRKIYSEDKPQRMSAKMAMEQMKVIQSESQRMAREANVTVPYHRPKQHTLQEFLSRRMVHKPEMSMGEGRKNVAAAIKMNPEDLEAYAKRLEEREKEAIEFFKSETYEKSEEEEQAGAVQLNSKLSDDEPAELPVDNNLVINNAPDDDGTQRNLDLTENLTADNTNQVKTTHTNVEHVAAPTISSIEKDPLDEIVNKTCENAEKMLAAQSTESHDYTSSAASVEPTSKQTHPIDYDLFSQSTSSKLAQQKVDLLADAAIPLFPTLHGSPNTVIDLDSGDVMPQAPTGASILLERFAKCSGKKTKKGTNFSILSTDKGAVEMDTIVLPLTPDERDPNGKEPIPGAAFNKLRQSLREKMEQTRREALRKRQEESQQAKTLDDDDDDEEEILGEPDEVDGEMDDEDEEEENETEEQEETTEENNNGLVDDEAAEADDEEDNEEANEDDEDESSDDSSDDETVNQMPVECEKRKSRIIAAFEDSDDDDELVLKESAKSDEVAVLKKTETDELFSTLEDADKFTDADRNNLETGDTMKLLWKDTEEPVTATQTADDLLALCSGRFSEDTQVPPLSITATQDTRSMSSTQPFVFSTQSDLDESVFSAGDKTARDTLFSQHSGKDQMDENELIALCSGTFATQRQPVELHQEPESEHPKNVIGKGKLVIASSDEEDVKHETKRSKKRKRKQKNNISDDEESASDADLNNSDGDLNDVELPATNDLAESEDEEEAERFVDYDSEENEVEVVMTKKDKQKVANAFLENEAELSESEWGSADEDEKDLDRYDIEVGDEEKYDQGKLHEELERIHARRMLEQDKKEVKALQEIYFEDEEKDGVGRDRQFRWRNAETTFSLDYDQKQPDDENDAEGGSDNETELQWRKLRHERELLLKEKKVNVDEVNLSALLDKSFEEVENISSVNNSTTSLAIKKKITIVRSKKSSEATCTKDSPFLITKSSIVQGHKASFLSRDKDTLNKLASLVKVPEIEGASTANAAKGRNFVFASVSPAIDKTGTKRALDAEIEDSPHNSKKVKIGATSLKGSATTKKRLLLGQLM
ncbi:claspin-like [Topomyia yanbarensis]|uniref:claspin-like n=1 Tax=Topomyia yanbarensis TaxID=2498891 RepID=UPI00273C4CBF|nr:claspin-like [Topomyia yanbarensis]